MGNFMEKTFVGGCKIEKFVKVFSLISFLLQGLFANSNEHATSLHIILSCVNLVEPFL